MAALYLIPVTLGDTPLDNVLPSANHDVIVRIRHFIVEEIRSARRFLKQTDKSIDIDTLTFYPMGKHADKALFSKYLDPLRNGVDMGIISEAGCPAIADPGADVVAIAQSEGLKVVPLVGPSSILMSLMASGFNGQQFAFHGYLPVGSHERQTALRRPQPNADFHRNALPQPPNDRQHHLGVPPNDKTLHSRRHNVWRQRVYPNQNHSTVAQRKILCPRPPKNTCYFPYLRRSRLKTYKKARSSTKTGLFYD